MFSESINKQLLLLVIFRAYISLTQFKRIRYIIIAFKIIMYLKRIEVDTDCKVYTNLTDSWRNVKEPSNGNTYFDTTLVAGWYRMIVNGLNAQIPTWFPGTSVCGSNSPIWYSGIIIIKVYYNTELYV